MIGKVLNLPFKVLGGVARAVQAQDAKKRSHAGADERAENAVTQGIDIRVPDDFDAGPIHLPAATAVTLTDSGCIIDATVLIFIDTSRTFGINMAFRGKRKI